jgi:hypothetical protein
MAHSDLPSGSNFEASAEYEFDEQGNARFIALSNSLNLCAIVLLILSIIDFGTLIAAHSKLGLWESMIGWISVVVMIFSTNLLKKSSNQFSLIVITTGSDIASLYNGLRYLKNAILSLILAILGQIFFGGFAFHQIIK